MGNKTDIWVDKMTLVWGAPAFPTLAIETIGLGLGLGIGLGIGLGLGLVRVRVRVRDSGCRNNGCRNCGMYPFSVTTFTKVMVSNTNL